MQQTSMIAALGARIPLIHSGDAAEAQGRLRDLHDIHEPFLASRVLPRTGLCIDIGSGAGWFGLAFAASFRDWHVICVESDLAEFAHLIENVDTLGLQNVTCIRAGIHPEAENETSISSPREVDDLNGATFASRLAARQGSFGEARFQRLPALGPRVAPALGELPEDEVDLRTAFPAALLSLAAPQLVKIDAPGAEQAIVEALQGNGADFITGHLHTHVPSRLFRSQARREIYLPESRHHALRRDYEDNFATRKPGLDVVVAMYNTRDYIVECVDSLLACGNEEIGIIVVDDGSTDGCGEMTRDHYAGNPRVRVIRKDNGGCASARNFGRRYSNASHIAFIDADDRVDPEMFSSLLDLARYTGSNVVEGEFKTFETDPEGADVFAQSVETQISPGPGRHRLGDLTYSRFSTATVMTGQPTIWRRIYRRDFLDRKEIFFPEHVRAFDDQIFQLLTAQYAEEIPHLFGHAYHYRQHPAQDIKQGDERHFYSLNMFRNVFLRAIDEGWDDIVPAVVSLVNTMAWSYGGLRPDLKPIYLEAAYGFLKTVAQTFGQHVVKDTLLLRMGDTLLPDMLMRKVDAGLEVDLSEAPEPPAEEGEAGAEDKILQQYANALSRRLRGEIRDVNHAYQRLESWNWQPEFIYMMTAVQEAGTTSKDESSGDARTARKPLSVFSRFMR